MGALLVFATARLFVKISYARKIPDEDKAVGPRERKQPTASPWELTGR